jgi:hypothetical protein
MIFSELYSVYYNAVAAILSAVINGEKDEKVLKSIVSKHAFAESALTILPNLKDEKWKLLKRDISTPLKFAPSMPLTTLEKRWLKAIMLDPRVRLFDINIDGLENVEPLFTCDDYYIYDKYMDGDPYYDEGYVSRFRMILRAIREKKPLTIEMVNRRGNIIKMNVTPVRLEYSEKDDKFRLITKGNRFGGTVNLARIVSCKEYSGRVFNINNPKGSESCCVTLRIYNERNALERCMLHFAHFEKQAERVDDMNYMVHIKYNKGDETEMVIRILGFGPLVEVVEPPLFRELIVDRLVKQKNYI